MNIKQAVKHTRDWIDDNMPDPSQSAEAKFALDHLEELLDLEGTKHHTSHSVEKRELAFAYITIDRLKEQTQTFLDGYNKSEDKTAYIPGTDRFLHGQIKGFEMALNIISESLDLIRVNNG